jgi:PAS domain S-box-containing protein
MRTRKTVLKDEKKRSLKTDDMVNDQFLLFNLLNSSTDRIYFKDLESRFIRVSKALAKRHGRSQKGMIGKTDFDLFGPIHAKQAFEDEQQIIKTEKPIIGKEEFEDLQNGKISWVNTSKMPLYNSDGKLIGTFGISRDVTRRKRAESIREALYYISEAVYSSKDITSLCEKIHSVISQLMPAKNFYISLYNEKTKVLTFPYYQDVHGAYKSSREITNGLIEYVLKTGKSELINAKRIRELKKKKKIESIELAAAIWLGVPLKADQKTIGAIVIQDYDNAHAFGDEELQILNFVAVQVASAIQRHITSEEIKKYTEELKTLNNTKDKLFSIISHDLRAPISGLLTFSELLLEDFESQSDYEKKLFVENLQSSMRNLFLFTENMLAWARLQSSGIKVNKQKIKLSDLINSVINTQLLNARNKGIKLRSSCPNNLEIYSDVNMIDTVIRNLLINAIKFTNNNGKIKISVVIKGNSVIVSVKDNGIGMSSELVNDLFNYESRKSREGTNHEKGSGLGMSICKEFIELNGGQIMVKSKPGEGTCVSFSIPINHSKKNRKYSE